MTLTTVVKNVVQQFKRNLLQVHLVVQIRHFTLGQSCSMGKVTAIDFYKAWIEKVTNRKEHLLSIWRNAKTYTSPKGTHERLGDNLDFEKVKKRWTD